MIHVDPALIAPAPTPAIATAAAARALIEGQLAMLTRLAQVGMEVAEACGREACAPDAAALAAGRDPGLAFARVARAVRMTIALQSRLAKDLAALDRAEAYAEADRRISRRARLQGLVGEAARTLVEARRKAEGQYWADDDNGEPEDDIEDEIERMTEVAYERLTDAEDGELYGLSFDEAVAGVCRDLGLSPDRTARLLAAMAAPAAQRGGGGGMACPLAASAPTLPAAPPGPPPAFALGP